MNPPKIGARNVSRKIANDTIWQIMEIRIQRNRRSLLAAAAELFHHPQYDVPGLVV